MTTTNNITVQFKQLFGIETIVPFCERAKLFCEIAGTKTLTKQAIASIKALGFHIDVKQEIRTI